MQKNLFSFIIISYKNCRYYPEILKSLFMQTYPEIELIIANDGSKDFKQDELTEYINENKGTNIKNIIIHNNEINLGTVQNIENARLMAHGEYIMYMSVDDALYDESTVANFVKKFQEEGEEALVVSCLTAMCTKDLGEFASYAPDEEGVNAIKALTPIELYSRLSHTFTIPTTSTAYRSKLYDTVGGFDTSYFLIEDATFFAKMCRMGVKVYWIDDMIGARHRDGGVSHSSAKEPTETFRRYRQDELNLYEKDVIPNKALISKADYKKFKINYQWLKGHYLRVYVMPNLPKKEKILFRLKYLPMTFLNALNRVRVKAMGVLPDVEFRRVSIGMCWSGFATLVFCACFISPRSWLMNAAILFLGIGLLCAVLHYLYRALLLAVDIIKYILLGR